MNEVSLLLESELQKKYESDSILHIEDSNEVKHTILYILIEMPRKTIEK